jgi:ribosomal-protein-alanine N-acetyltransferase
MSPPTAYTELDTPHLRLVPNSPAHVLALRESVDSFQRASGLRVLPSLRAFVTGAEVSAHWLERVRRAPPDVNPWLHGLGVLHRMDDCVMGAAGFVGIPDADGVAEIAYGIAPEYQGRGYATEAAQALVAFASADSRVRRLRAHTYTATNASTRVLAKCGFTFVGPIEHPEDGLVWRWERESVR